MFIMLTDEKHPSFTTDQTESTLKLWLMKVVSNSVMIFAFLIQFVNRKTELSN